nr:hypothetical protein [Tanacetum cinerariifolium]
ISSLASLLGYGGSGGGEGLLPRGFLGFCWGKDLKSDKGDDDNEIDMIQSSRGNEYTKRMLFNLIKNLYVPFGISFDPKRYYKDGDYTRILQRPSQMHNNIMAAGSRDHPPMLVMGPIPEKENSPAVPEHITVETLLNMSSENKAQFESEKEAVHLILTGIGDEIYSTIDACNTAHEMWEAIKRLQQEWSRFLTIVKKQHKLDEVSYHKLFHILKQYQKEVNKLRVERIAMNANPLVLVATAQPNQDPYYETPKSQKSYAPISKASLLTRSHTTTRNKGKEIAKPITPPSKSASEEDSEPKQAQRDKDMQKIWHSLQNTSKRSTNLQTTTSKLL